MIRDGSERAPELRVHHPRHGAAVVELLGEHDLATRKTTQDLLTRLIDEHELVVVDLSETLFIDSSVLECLVRAHLHAEAKGKSMRLQIGSASIVEKIFEIAGLMTYFDVVADREHALRL